MKLPRIIDGPNDVSDGLLCTTCGREIQGRVWIVDPDGHENPACSDDCADAEAFALADLNPDTDWK